jgi:type II secretory pathway predicted ATPase ExeA
MYLEYFGFKINPFQMTPDNEFLYMSQQHAKALVYMDYAAWKPGGFVVITGEIGAGKTTLVKWLLKNFSGKANCFHVAFTNLSGNDLFHYLLRQVNIIPKKEDKISLIYTFQEHIRKLSKTGKPCVLIIDEAQNLTKDQLEDIRMLAALEGPDGPLLRVTLLAQPEFLYMVNASEQFKQRVKLHYHLKGLSHDDVKKYIQYRLIKSGLAENNLFDQETVDEIYKYSKGIPRLINKICDALLMCAYAEDKETPSATDLEGVLSDLMIDDPSGEAVNQIDKAISNLNQVSVKDSSDVLERLVGAVEKLNESLSIIAGKK